MSVLAPQFTYLISRASTLSTTAPGARDRSSRSSNHAL